MHKLPEQFNSYDKMATKTSLTVHDIICAWVNNNLGLTDPIDKHNKICCILAALQRSNTENILFTYTPLAEFKVSNNFVTGYNSINLNSFVEIEYRNDKFYITFNKNNIIEEITA